jgi:hypothetical protein
MPELQTETLRSLMYKIMDRTSIKGTLASHGISNNDLSSFIFVDYPKGGIISTGTEVVSSIEDNAVELCTLGQLCTFIDSQRSKQAGDGRIPDLFANSYNRLGAALMFANVVNPPAKNRRHV